MTLSIGRFEELIVLRLSRTEDDDYLQNQLLRLSKSEARLSSESAAEVEQVRGTSRSPLRYPVRRLLRYFRNFIY